MSLPATFDLTPATFDLTPEDAQLLLAANAHLGARNVQVCFKINT